MLEELKNGTKAVGAKQTKRALVEQKALCVFFALDADPALCDPIRALCQQSGVKTVEVATMKELGQACSIAVGAAVATLLAAD